MPDAPVQPALCPAPERVEWRSGRCAVPPTARVDLDAMLAGGSAPGWLEVVRDASLAQGAYRLNLSPNAPARAVIADDDGARHAAATLLQLLRPDGLPAARIEDHPALPVRGLMLDVSRDRIPTMRELHDLVRTMARLKLNHLQLYVEHTIAYAGHERVWSGWSPLTFEEIDRLQSWCQRFGIELAANQNCFGHLSEWLRTPGYEHLAETHGEYDFYGLRRAGPFSLCPTDPASLDLVRDLLAQNARVFASPLVNIGCDETADVGAGRSAQAVAREGRAAVYGRYVSEVARAAIGLGKRPMFWADIALSEPAVLDRLPRELIAIAWGYEADSDFDAWCAQLSAHGFEAWVSPGTSAWRSIAGRTSERRANLLAAARAARRHGCRGMLITEWGDLGHRQPWPVALLAIAEAAQAAWNPDAPFDARAAGQAVLHSPDLGAWLAELGDADRPLRERYGFPRPDGSRGRLLNAGAVFTDLHPARPDWGTPGSIEEWAAAADRIDHLARARPPAPDPLVDDECALAAEVMSAGAARAMLRRAGPGDARALAERFAGIARTHRRLWLARARVGGLDRSTRWYEAVAEELAR